MTDTDLLSIMEILACEPRWTIYQHLVHAGGDFPTHIAAILGMNATTVSFHLTKMASVKLLYRNQMSTFALFSVNPQVLDRLTNRLLELRKALPDESIRTENQPAESPGLRAIRHREDGIDNDVGGTTPDAGPKQRAPNVHDIEGSVDE